MKKSVLFFSANVLLLFFLVMIVFSGTVLAQATPIQDVSKSVVRIEVRESGWENKANPQIARGSGFVIGTEPPFQYVATAWTIANPTWDLSNNRFETNEFDVFIFRSRDDYVPATVHISLERSNIVLLKLDPAHLLYPYEPLKIADASMVNVGEDIFVVGFTRFVATARPADAVVISGNLSRVATPDVALQYIMTGNRVDMGLEGGPLVNKDGHVIGVARLRMPADTNFSGGMAIELLVEALEGRNIAFAKVGAAPPPEDEIEEVVIEPLPQVATPQLTLEGILSWENVSDAQGYDVILFRDGNRVHSSAVGANTTKVNLSEFMKSMGPGSYSAQVMAIGGGDFIDGPISSPSNTIIIEKGISPLLIGIIGGVILLLIVLTVLFVSMSKKKKTPAAVSKTPVTQKASVPATQAKSEPAAAPVTKAKPAAPRAGIKGISGQFAKQTIELVDNQLVIGRDPRLSQLVYPQASEEISRKHLTIRFDERSNKFILEDSSSNGTFLSSNQKMETGKPYYLNSGDRFYIADPKEVYELVMV